MKANLYAAFMDGTLKGLKLGAYNMLPNVTLAFALIRALEVSGLLEGLGILCAPLMALLGLPGEAAAVLISTWFSAGGGVGAAVSLYAQGILKPEHLSILMPGIFLMGAQIQYAGRILAVAGVNSRHYPVLCLIGIINAIMGMLTMKWFFV